MANLGLILQPYMMFTARSGDGFTWRDIINDRSIPSKMNFNNYGFAEDWDYTIAPDAKYLEAHGKKPGERIVLMTGGSVVHGVGASGNEKTISARLMWHLNEQSGGRRYRVINIGMGSWIAYQQFLGLSLFGLPFDPDWVVVMDAHNDAVTACAQGSGAGAPLAWPKFVYLANGGALNETSPLLDGALRRSALVRLVTGMAPTQHAGTPRGLYVDGSEPDERFRIKLEGLKVREEDRQVDFYLQAQRNVLSLFHRSSVLFSTQPYYYDNAVSPSYRPAFGPAASDATRAGLRDDLDRFMRQKGQAPCSSELASQMLGYFAGRSGLLLRELAGVAQAAETSRKVVYTNTEAVFPYEGKARAPYFIDNAHMSDEGQDRIARFFAALILSAERSVEFDYGAFTKQGEGQPKINQ
jgi:hypothetical protein